MIRRPRFPCLLPFNSCGSEPTIGQMKKIGSGGTHILSLTVIYKSKLLAAVKKTWNNLIKVEIENVGCEIDKDYEIDYENMYLVYLLISTLEYTNWEGGIENIGCVSTKCSEYSGLAINPKSGFTWNAFNKDTALPYICVSKCPVNFKWYPGKNQFSKWPLLTTLDLNVKDDII